MASIIKRKTKYSVVYTYTDSNGAKRQKWETCGSHAEAKKRKAEIEHQLDTGVFIPPSADTLSDFLDEYVSLYGVNTWAPSTFDGHTALISNYIKPIIGDVKLDDISPRMITKSGKNCPKYYVENPEAWEQMKADIAAQIQEDYILQENL